jgi:GDPmannose 4,6-dehydratase
VSRSWADPERTAEVTGLGTLRLLEAIRLCGLIDRVRFYQASSCEMYGRTASPQDETTAFSPVHPYGVAKVFAHQATVMFRQAYGLFAVAGILFNHESPRRGHEFVTRKITRGVARIALGLEDRLVLGDLDVRRDWGYAPEYVEAMWRMMQQPVPGDYVIATGVTRSLHDFLRLSFREVGIEDYAPYVRHDWRLLRPADIAELRGNPAKARRLLDWEARTGFEELVRILVAADLRREGEALRAEPVGGRA